MSFLKQYLMCILYIHAANIQVSLSYSLWFSHVKGPADPHGQVSTAEMTSMKV